jgi:type II pantothenate kinase
MCSELPDSTTFGSTIQESLGRPSPGALTAGQLPLLEAEPDVFPCILSICGSAFFSLRIEKDGSFKIADGTTRSGKAVFGIGALLTGCETYSELIQLAEKGSPRGVDQYTDELGEISDAADGDSSMYTKHDEVQLAPAVVFSFGKTVGRKLADLKREDLARSWLTYFILDLVQCTHFLATSHGIKRVFFSGGFCDHPLVRNIITTEFVRRSLTRTLLSAPGAVQFDFIKPGAYLGALGCLVSDIEASSSTVTGQSTDE